MIHLLITSLLLGDEKQNKTYEQRKNAPPVISQPSLLLLSWDVKDWGLMKEGEKVKEKP